MRWRIWCNRTVQLYGYLYNFVHFVSAPTHYTPLQQSGKGVNWFHFVRPSDRLSVRLLQNCVRHVDRFHIGSSYLATSVGVSCVKVFKINRKFVYLAIFLNLSFQFVTMTSSCVHVMSRVMLIPCLSLSCRHCKFSLAMPVEAFLIIKSRDYVYRNDST